MTSTNPNDYLSERLAHWNKDPNDAIALLGVFMNDKSIDDIDLLAIDRRTDDSTTRMATFIGHVGLELTDTGFPIHESSLVHISKHETGKSKQFYDFVSDLNGFFLHERRIFLPREEAVVAHLFRAIREMPKLN